MTLRKNLLVLPLTMLLLTSCGASSISYEDAVKFVNDNYTATEAKTPKKGITKCQGYASNDASKAAMADNLKMIGITLNENNHYENEETEGLLPIPVLKSEQLPKAKDETTTSTYQVKGKQLIVVQHTKMQFDHSVTETTSESYFNDQGYQYKQNFVFGYKDDVDDKNIIDFSYTLVLISEF